jgi:hypothetical protein
VPTNSYDLIVLGDATPGLACAALCARRGLRTLVLADETRPARYALGALRLPTAAPILPGRGGGASARVIRDLGLDHALKRRVRDGRVTTQLVGPDLRLDLVAEAAGQAKEWMRELPGATDGVLAAWDRAADIAKLTASLVTSDGAFPGVGFFERRDAVKQATRAAEVAAAWWTEATATPGPAAVLTGLPTALGDRALATPPLAVAHALELWRAGAPGLRGDGTGLRELLIEKLTAAGGELRVGVAAELVAGWTKLTAVRLATGEELGAGQVVSALPVGELVPLLGAKPPRRVVELAEAATVAGWHYAINLVIDAAAVPEGMAATVLAVADTERPLTDGNGLTVHVGEADDQGRVVLTATAIAAADGPTAPGPARLAEVRLRVLEHLETIVPFAHQHLIVMHSPYDGLDPVVPGGRAGYEPPRTGPSTPPAIWRAGLPDTGSLAAAPYATGVKNLTLCSSQVLPTLGQDGELAVAWNAARIACGIAGKKRDFLRDEVVAT